MPKQNPTDQAAEPDPSRATMADVARAAGVGLGTVSRAINHPDRVSPQALTAVHEAIERLQYLPNLTAGSLKSSRSRIVGCVVPTISGSVFAAPVEGLTTVLERERHQLLIGETRYRVGEEARLADAFVGRRVDALVLIGTVHSPGLDARLRRSGVPVVEAWELTRHPIDMVVGFSNERAGGAVARYFAAKDYRELGYIGSHDARSEARSRGLSRAAKRLGLPAVRVALSASPLSLRDVPASLAALLAGPVPVRAVLCSHDMVALTVLFECRRRGLRVPEDLAVMGFADLPMAEMAEPTLSTVQVNSREIGERAAEMLLSELRGEPVDERIVDLGFTIIERNST